MVPPGIDQRSLPSSIFNSLTNDLVNSNLPGSYSAVLLLFVCSKSSAEPANLLLSERSLSVSTHKGQIAFAGGKNDCYEKSPRDTAFREASEELGIDPKDLYFHGIMKHEYALSGEPVYPVIASCCIDTSAFQPNKDEIAKIFFVPWEFFARNKAEFFRFNQFGIWRDSIRFRAEDLIVWGLTAKILYSANLHV